MTPNSTRAPLAMLASTRRRIATSESFMPECVLSPRTGVTHRLYCKRTGLREIDTSNDPFSTPHGFMADQKLTGTPVVRRGDPTARLDPQVLPHPRGSAVGKGMET